MRVWPLREIAMKNWWKEIAAVGALLTLGPLLFLRPQFVSSVIARCVVFAARSEYVSRTNLSTELRDGFVGYGRLLWAADLKEWEEGARVIETRGNMSLWDSRAGRFWLPAGQGAATLADMAQITRLGVYEYESRGVKDGDIVLDAGAHVGSFVRAALDRGAARVVAIEPVALNLDCLRKTFDGKVRSGRVVPLPVAILDRDGEMWIGSDDGMSGEVSGKPREKGESEKVEVTTIDAIVDKLALARVDFIKMDIEGAERLAVMGARATIQRWHPMLAIATEHTDDLRGNTLEVIRRVQAIYPKYSVGYGRYQCAGRKACVPMEVFFYANSAEPARARRLL
jgi:FkbM family methyltransferase